MLFAHSLQDRPESEWEPLDKHLRDVAELTAGFASVFGAAEWGRLAGLWHDLGKYRPEFQDRLRGSNRSVEHAGAGAALAFGVDRQAGLPLAFAIAGHHAGLADLQPGGGTGPRALTERLAGNKPVLDGLLPSLPPELTSLSIPALPLAAELPPDRRVSPVNRRRAEVLAACRAAAERPPGLFSLTVPTGGGKTFSSMAFALRHAEVHGLRRVVVAIPFTSIIEQNAAVYRRALGDANVIEHHSAFDATAAEEADRGAEIRRRLATENWDAPVVVTTNVQLFESLFAASPSRCRKLHNLAGSVILLDEAQTLPVEYLLPVLDSLRELTSRFGCTAVLMTATQPALQRRGSLPQGLEGLHEIIPDPPALARDLSRVRVSWPEPDAPPRSYEDLAREVAGHERVLAVVHRRDDARLLAGLLPEEGRFHLSALMCAAHRSEVLGQVVKALGEGRPCRLVATQLIEAGVDVDFPVVYRCLGGLDSLTQAAGRCNREGRMPDKGSAVFFLAETRPPSGLPRKGLEEVQTMLRAAKGSGIDLDDPQVFDEYFRGLYSRCEKDPKGIQPLREGLSFHSVARKLRLIEDATTPVVVPWGAAAERLETLRRLGPDRLRLRSLQPFVVDLYETSVSKLRNAGALEEIVEGVLALAPPYLGLYDERFGLVVDGELRPDAELLIV